MATVISGIIAKKFYNSNINRNHIQLVRYGTLFSGISYWLVLAENISVRISPSINFFK